MRAHRRSLPLLVAAAVLVAGPAVAQQRMPPPEQEQMTQQMQQRMAAMQQNMQRLRERIHVVDGAIVRALERVQDQQRIREHQALRETCAGLSEMTRQMERSALRLQEMDRNQVFQQDGELRRETERLREQFRLMETRMEESVQSLERMQHRLEQMTESGS
ncbi:MAG: hypothetical protein ABFS34_10880 [Gemmatimonadota bacterium]